MKKYSIITVAFCLLLTSTLSASVNIYRGTPSFTVGGGYALPFGAYAKKVEGGPAMYFSCQYQPTESLMGSLLGWRYFFFEGGFQFMNTPPKDSPRSSMRWYSLDMGPVVYYPLFRWACPYLGASAGWHFSVLKLDATGKNESNNSFLARARAGIMIPATSSLSFRIEGSYSYYHLQPTAFNSTGITLGASYNFSGDYGSMVSGSDASVKIVSTNLKEIYAIRYRQYNSQGIGTVSIRNTGGEPLYNIRIYSDIEGVSSEPRCAEPVESLAPGETRALYLPISISDRILTLTEDGPCSLRLRVVYGSASSKFYYNESADIQVYSKNAMSWDRTERLGSFIMPRDATISSFSRRILSQVNESSGKGISKKIYTAMVLYDALGACGLTYVNDPRNTFSSGASGRRVIDYVQLPGETLNKKAGDCDDLTVLYASLLEGVGISTAIATIPGHVFLLFNTEVIESSAREISDDPGDYIIRGGTVWIPVEVTMVRDGFNAAWRNGISGINRGGFAAVDTLKAWEEFPPADNELDFSIDVPDGATLMARVNGDIDNIRKNLLDRKVEQLKAALAANGRDFRTWNELGIVYGRFNMLTEAEECFNTAVSISATYHPALCNLGNIAMLKRNYENAVSFYGRALALDSGNTNTIINHARALYELKRYDQASEEYRKAVSKNPGVSARYGYLARSTAGSAAEGRAAYGADRNELNAWSGR